MAWKNIVYANFDLATGNNDGTTEEHAWQSAAAVTAGIAPGDYLYIKKQATPYNPTDGSIASSVAGTVTDPIHVEGYETTPGDGGYWEFDFSDSVTSFNIGNHYWSFSNLKGTDSGVSLAEVTFGGSRGGFNWNCYVKIFGETNMLNGFNCYIENTRPNSAISILGTNSDNSYFNRCYFRGYGSSNRMVSVDAYGRAVNFHNCIFHSEDILNDALVIGRIGNGRGVSISNCFFYNCRNGVNAFSSPFDADALKEWLIIERNVFSTIGARCVQTGGTPENNFTKIRDNYYHNVTTGFTNYDDRTTFNNQALTANPFVDAASGDFRLNDDPDGGVVLKAANFPVNMVNNWTAPISPNGVYQGPTPSEIAAAVWNRGGRSLTA
jgi:hypothetical protein